MVRNGRPALGPFVLKRVDDLLHGLGLLGNQCIGFEH